MPRVSAAALSVVGPNGIDSVLRRPKPPSELTPEQAHEWRVIVNRMSPDWFPRETHGLLVEYCRLIVDARRFSVLRDAAAERALSGHPTYIKAYRDMIRTADGITRSLAILSTKMRLNQSSSRRQDRGASDKPSMLPLPWENDE